MGGACPAPTVRRAGGRIVGRAMPQGERETLESADMVNKYSAEQSAGVINNHYEGTAPKIASDKVLIAPYNPDWAFSHHGAIASFKGKLYVLYASGRVNEDHCGQRIMVTSSSNFYNWSTPSPLKDVTMGLYSQIVSSTGGLYTDGTTLVAYYFCREYDPAYLQGENLRPSTDGHTLWLKTYYRTTTDGVNWSNEVELTNLNTPLFTNPKTLLSGRLMMTGGSRFAYTDDPAGLTGWQLKGLTQNQLTAALTISGINAVSEASLFQTTDGIIHMMHRSGGNYLLCSESRDDGVTWSQPYKTDFTDNVNKSYFGTLPDGRYYYVGTPSLTGSRIPLMLNVSSDGYNFSTQYILRDEPYQLIQPGFAKSGNYGYPSVVAADGYLYTVYSKQKEIMEITRVALNNI
jgi:hypothetical protein